MLLAAMVGLTIATAACSSGGTTRSNSAGAAAAASTTNAATTKDGDERLTPLSAFFTEGRGGEPTQAERDAAAEDFRRQEQSIADCMHAQGFEYIQGDYNEAVDAKVKNLEAFDLPPDQYAERWGYGISTIDPSQYTAESPDDPNSAIVEALSPEARAAYEKALYGIEISREGGNVSRKEGPDGCQTRAMQEVYGEGFNGRDDPAPAEFDGLNEEMGALWDRVVNDPRVIEAKKGWANCMADAGHPEATDPDNAVQLVIQRFSTLYGVEPGQFKEVRAGMKSAPQQPDAAALAEVQSYERGLAMADRRCKATYEDVVFTVQSEVENRFIDEHRAELERYRDSVGLQGRGRIRGRVFIGGRG